MGAIQNSLNSMLATVMGGVLGMKHIQKQNAALKQAEINELVDLSEKAPKLDKELEAKTSERENLLSDARQLNKGNIQLQFPGEEGSIWIKANGKEGLEELTRQKEMNIRALKSSKNEIEASSLHKILMNQRIKELKNKYGAELNELKQQAMNRNEIPKEEKVKPVNGGAF